MKMKNACALCALICSGLAGPLTVAGQDELSQRIPLPRGTFDEPPPTRAASSDLGNTAGLFRATPAPLAPVAGVPLWTALGPAPIPNGQTEGRTDPVSGRVTAIAVHPSNPDIVYVGTAQGGVYRSLNAGATWVALLDNALSLAVGAIAIAPSSPTTVFVGTGEGNFSFDSFFGVGVYRIDDAETTATLVGPLNLDGAGNDVFTGASITRILVHPTDPGTIFVSTVSGVGGKNGSLPANAPAFGVYRSVSALSLNATFAKLNVPTAAGASGNVTDMVMEPGNANHLVCAVKGANAAGDGGI